MSRRVKYLNPKADVTFKKIFSNPDLLISLLNALLPLDDDKQIENIEYLPTEIETVNPFRKNTIVDVRCKDTTGRQFVVEMQMEWTTAFMQRVLFNASKAYVSQAGKGYEYKDMEPVYALSLINDTYTPKDNTGCIHHYNIVCDEDTKMIIEGLHFTFVELPKFRPDTFAEKRMAVLWLRFLTEISEDTDEAPQALLDNPDTNKALGVVRESAMDEDELRAYDKFWDIIRYERTLYAGKFRDGLERGYEKGVELGMVQGMAQGRAEGMAQGRAEGRAEGMAQGRAEGRAEGLVEGVLAIARNLKAKGMPADFIAEATGLTTQEVEEL